MQTTITLYNNYNGHFKQLPECLPELIKRLTEILETVPSEYHDDVFLEMTSDEDTSSVDASIFYVREETLGEKVKREAFDAIKKEAFEFRQRKEYERLKKQFEP